jgi:FkbM family methyltransferase
MAVAGYRNPVELIVRLIRGGGPATGILDNGLRISAPEVTTLLATVQEVFTERAYTPEHFEIEPGDVVVDIGAHVGTFTLMAARAGAGAVYAYEPLPENAELLRRNLEANGVMNVTVHQCAVGGADGTSTFRVGLYSVGGSLDGIAPAHERGRTITVRTVCLATVMAENGLERIDVLKLDCEGAEGEIIEGVERVEKIVLEYHDGWSRLDHDALMRALQRAGFEVTIRPDRDPRFGYLYARRSK